VVGISLGKGTKWVIAISAFIALYIGVSFSLFTHESFQTWLVNLSPTNPFNTFMVLLLLCGLASIGVPRQVVAFTCGYFFQVFYGTLFATIAVTIGALITLVTARAFSPESLLSKYHLELGKINSFLSKDTLKKTIIIRLLPIGSNFITNILAGIAHIPVKPYIVGSFIGFIPQMFIFSLAGTGVKLAAMEHITVSIILFVIAMLLSWQLYRRTSM
jgi:uncharacterized membrane protein YdjX (TVP38/TMEM64 family)